VSTFDPDCRAIPLTVQPVVPLAVPEPPRLLAQVTWVTPTLSDAVPCSVREELAVVYGGPDVGDVIAIVGFVVSAVPTPRPVTTPLMVPPFAVKLRVALTVVVVVGVKRTFTGCVVPVPVIENGLPDTIVNGRGTDALPETVPPEVFDTVYVCSTKLPRFTLPKFTEPPGLTAKSLRATALAAGEHGLWLPLVSTALTDTKYIVPGASPVSRRFTIWFDDGLVVADATVKNDEPGQGGFEVP